MFMNKNCVWGGQINYETSTITSIEANGEHVLCASFISTENEDYGFIGGNDGGVDW